MATYAAMRALRVWYATIDVDEALATIGDAERRRSARKQVSTAIAPEHA